MNDPAAQIGVQLGQNAFKAGQEYFEHNVGSTLPYPNLPTHKRLGEDRYWRELAYIFACV